MYAHLPRLPKLQAKVLMLLGGDAKGENNFTPLIRILAAKILVFDSGELGKKYFVSHKVE